jgi:hypothetical protein
MLSLESKRWAELKASPGGNGELALRLLEQARGGDAAAFDELMHQVCHQMTVGEVAYAVVPHLVELARHPVPSDRVGALTIVGWVVASAQLNRAPAVPADLESAYRDSQQPALVLTLRALEDSSLDRNVVLDLLGVAAALKGNPHLAIHLLLHDGYGNLSCPECGEYIRFGDVPDEGG